MVNRLDPNASFAAYYGLATIAIHKQQQQNLNGAEAGFNSEGDNES